MIAGEWTGTMNLTEPQAGSDLAAGAHAAPSRRATARYKVFGTKIFITYGEHDMAENIVHLVLARIAGAPEGVKGISLFIVPKFLVNADGSLGARNDVHCVSHRAQARHQGEPDRGAAVRRPRRRDRLPGRRGEPRPRVHVHHDERGALRGRHAGHRDRRARLPAGASAYAKERVQARPVDGSVARQRADHPPPRRAAHADDDARPDRGCARAGATSPPPRSTPRTTIPMPTRASSNQAFVRVHGAARQGLVHRDGHRGRRASACRCTAAWASSRRPARRSTCATRAS